MYTIYKHTCPNGKVYIGQTKLKPKVRWNNGYGYSHQTVFFTDILTFGWNNIKHEILETVETKEEARERERYYILKYRSNEPEFGYNKNCNKDKYYECKLKGHYLILCIETGEYFSSYSEASRTYGVDVSSLSKAAKGIRKSAGGYHWKIAN